MKLKEKYVSPRYKCQLFSKLNNISQISTVADYIVRFDELRLRCGLKEDPLSLLSRFVDGLRPDVQRDLRLNFPEILEDAYNKAQEIETLSNYSNF